MFVGKIFPLLLKMIVGLYLIVSQMKYINGLHSVYWRKASQTLGGFG